MAIIDKLTKPKINIEKEKKRIEQDVINTKKRILDLNVNIGRIEKKIKTSDVIGDNNEYGDETDHSSSNDDIRLQLVKRVNIYKKERTEKKEYIKRLQASLYNLTQRLRKIDNDTKKSVAVKDDDADYEYMNVNERTTSNPLMAGLLHESAADTVKQGFSTFGLAVRKRGEAAVKTVERANKKLDIKISDLNDIIVTKKALIGDLNKNVTALQSDLEMRASNISAYKKAAIKDKIRDFKEQIVEVKSDIKNLMTRKFDLEKQRDS